MRTHIIGLTGYAGSGKDTVGDLLAEHCGYRKLAYADALRKEVSAAFGVPLDVLIDPVRKSVPLPALAMRLAPAEFFIAVVNALQRAQPDNPFGGGNGAQPMTLGVWRAEPRTPRQILQWWGTEYRRAQDRDYWTRRLAERVRAYSDEQHERRFAITDVRFENEADTVLRLGGRIWQIVRPGIDGADEGPHASCTDGSKFAPAAVICNRYDIRHLQGVVLAESLALEMGIPSSKVGLTSSPP